MKAAHRRALQLVDEQRKSAQAIDAAIRALVAAIEASEVDVRELNAIMGRLDNGVGFSVAPEPGGFSPRQLAEELLGTRLLPIFERAAKKRLDQIERHVLECAGLEAWPLPPAA